MIQERARKHEGKQLQKEDTGRKRGREGGNERQRQRRQRNG